LFVNDERGGKDWFSIAGKYDKGVEDMVSNREAVLKEIEDGNLNVIKVSVCAEPETVNGKQNVSLHSNASSTDFRNTVFLLSP
jgi:hypothetical protein